MKENIQKYEIIKDNTETLLSRLDKDILEWEKHLEDFKTLNDYFNSTQWIEDYEASNRGEYADIVCGVLSQDLPYDIYQKMKSLNLRMAKIALSYLQVI